MVNERRANFLRQYGTASAALASQEYLTDPRMKLIESRLAIQWEVYAPNFGLKWAMRPVIARLRRRREPARFRIYAARKAQ